MLLMVGVLAATTAPFGSTATVQAAGELGAGGEFHPLAPVTIHDTRSGSPAPSNSTTPTFNVTLLGAAGVPASAASVLAVAVTVTISQPTQNGNVRLAAAGTPLPTSAALAYGAGRTVSNSAVVRPGVNGQLTVGLNSGVAGSAHVTVDVHGWWSTSGHATRGARLVAINPSRIMDTRSGWNGALGVIPAGGTARLPIRGVTGVHPTIFNVVPNSPDVVAVMLNVAVINTVAGSQVTSMAVVSQPPAAAPTVFDVQAPAAAVRSTMVIAPVGPDGSVYFYNRAGSTHVAADVVGYFVNNADVNTRAGRVVPLAAPFRAFDTRQAQWGAVRLGPGQAEDWSFAAFAASVNIDAVAVGAQNAVIGNLSVTDVVRQYPTVAANGYLTLYASDVARPIAASLNTVEGTAVSNMSMVRYSAGTTLRGYNANGSVNYVFDAMAVVLRD